MAVELGTDLKTCPEFMRGSRQRDECEDVRSGADGTRATARATPNFCRDSIIGTLSATVPTKKKKKKKKKRPNHTPVAKPRAGGEGDHKLTIANASGVGISRQIIPHAGNYMNLRFRITVATNIGGGIGLRGVAIRRPAALDGVHDYYGAFHPGTGTTKPQGEFGDEPGSAANLGDLDYRPTRHALVLGNLALLQVQALIVGSIAGLFSFAMGTITHPKDLNSYYESMLMITSAMLCAALSSLVLGTFMCALVILCRWAKINPDNIACPMASSLGDVITLIILAVVSHGLMTQMDTFWSTGLFVASVACIPMFAWSVWNNKLVNILLFSGWTPILVAM
ncbi:hypothetical protein BC936DRAFT_148872, partial [Jimgerdemannia flammicorona]